MEQPGISYDEKRQIAQLTFASGRVMKLSNVTKEQAEAFAAKHGAEFGRRDCRFTTEGVVLTREGDRNG